MNFLQVVSWALVFVWKDLKFQFFRFGGFLKKRFFSKKQTQQEIVASNSSRPVAGRTDVGLISVEEESPAWVLKLEQEYLAETGFEQTSRRKGIADTLPKI